MNHKIQKCHIKDTYPLAELLFLINSGTTFYLKSAAGFPGNDFHWVYVETNSSPHQLLIDMNNSHDNGVGWQLSAVKASDFPTYCKFNPKTTATNGPFLFNNPWA